MENKFIVLGMGNTLLGDDGVGIYVTKELEKRLSGRKDISFEYVTWGGLRIIDLLKNYKYALVIDAVNTFEKPEGYIHEMEHTSLLHSIRMVSFHDVNFATAVKFASMLNIPMPESIHVFGIEVRNTDTFRESLTPAALKAAEKCIRLAMNRIKKINNKYPVLISP